MRLRRFLRIDRDVAGVTADVDTELRFHFDMTVAELVAQGMSDADARRETERRFGDVRAARGRLEALDRARVRQARRAGWADMLEKDVKYAIRGLARAPGFAAVVIATLALGIGANATMFGIIDQLLLRPPPHLTDGERLTRLYFTRRVGGFGGRTTAQTNGPVYFAFAQRATTLAGIAGYFNSRESVVGRGETAERAHVVLATGNYFSVLGVKPALGRFFGASDDRPPVGEMIAVLGHRYWRSRFGGSATAIGQRVLIDDRSYTVIGVAPEGFGGPDIAVVDAWIPISSAGDRVASRDWHTDGGLAWLITVARLAPGATRDRATAELDAIHQSIVSDTSSVSYGRVIAAPIQLAREPAITDRRTGASIATWLGGVSVIVLLIACANVANLLLARALRRRREIAVRVALGVSHRRLAMQLLTESFVIAALGGAVALFVARWGGSLVRRVLLPDIQWSTEWADGRILALTAAATLVTGVLIGLAPLWHVRDRRVLDPLRAGMRGDLRQHARLRGGLLIAQAALSVVLLVGAGLFVRSLRAINSLEYGYDARSVLLVEPVFRAGTARAERVATFERLRDAAARLPGVDRAALAHTAPFWSAMAGSLTIPNAAVPLRRDELGFRMHSNAVSPDYFTTMGTRILRGRPFTEADTREAPGVVIINQTLARRAWPSDDPLGKCVKVGADTAPCSTVVGVAMDKRVRTLREEPLAEYYVPLSQGRANVGIRTMFVRTGGDPHAAATAISRALLASEPSLNWIRTGTLQDNIEPQIRPWRLGATMFTVFGVLSLVVAAIGLYSVIAYSVAQRTHEFGVRVALGAPLRHIVSLVFVRGLGATVAGLAIGLVVATATGRFIEPLLFDTTVRSADVMVVVVATLLVVSAAACLVPAWRASRVDPVESLRAD